MKTAIEESIILQGGLKVRRGNGVLLLEWKSNCNYLDIVVERHICVGIDQKTAVLWLQIIEMDTESNCTDGDILLQHTPLGLSLNFTRTFLNPKTILLTSIAQEKLNLVLKDFLCQ